MKISDSLLTELYNNSAEELAEVLWFATKIKSSVVSAKNVILDEKPITPQLDSPSDDEYEEPPQLENRPDDIQETEPDLIPTAEIPQTYPLVPKTNNSTGHPIRVPATTMLSGVLKLEKALRPLMIKVPSRRKFVLDEAATVQQIAEQDIWLPVLKGVSERWFKIVLVVDQSASMKVWQSTIYEWRKLLQRHTAFQSVHTIKLEASEQDIKLYTGSRLCHKESIVDPLGQQLILIASDCASPAWYSGQIAELLEFLGKSNPITIVQMLPQWMWTSSGLVEAARVNFHAKVPSSPNTKLVVDDDWLDELPKGMNVPVVTLEPESLSFWSRSLMGKPNAWISGVIFKPSDKQKAFFAQIEEKIETLKPLSAEQRLQRFRATASPTAQELVEYLAAAPLSLDVMRLVQCVMLPESRQVHLAEIFLSGLIKRAEAHEYIEYEFHEGVRDLLLESALLPDSVDVLKAVSKYLMQHWGCPLDFQAILVNPNELEGKVIGGQHHKFAEINGKILEQLGGEYAVIARRLQPKKKLDSETHSSEKKEKYGVNKGNKKKILLMLAANPKDTGYLFSSEEAEEIKNALLNSDSFEVVDKLAVSKDDFISTIQKEVPDIVHFGGYIGSSKGIIFKDKYGKKVNIRNDELINFFQADEKNIDCVVLNTSSKESSAAENIAQYVKYVIDIKKDETDKVARDFSVSFYNALEAGKDIERAFEEAKNFVTLETDTKQESYPILLKRGRLTTSLKTFEEILNNPLEDGGYGNWEYSLEHKFGFQNRVDEIKSIMNPLHALSVIDAPYGYGKSALLLQLKHKFTQKGYQCIGIDLEKELILNKSMIENMNLIRDRVRDLKKVVLMFDNTEKLKNEQFEALQEIILKSYEYFFISREFRVIFSGCYISTYNQKFHLGKNFNICKLTSLDSFVIQNLITETSLKNANSEYIKDWTKLVNDISCGHARIVIKLIEKIEESPIYYLDLNNKQKVEVFKKFTLPEIEVTMAELDGVVQKSLRKLSIFRRFNTEIIQELKNRNYLSQDLYATTLLRNIRMTGLIRENQSEWFIDSILRELLLKQIQLLRPDEYISLQEAATKMYWNWLLQLKNISIPGQDVLSMAEIYIREYIYHALLYCQFLSDKNLLLSIKGICSNLHNKLKGYAPTEEIKELIIVCMIKDINITSILDEYNIDIDSIF
ncbi:SAV_2336 N-terminal domain-related protein [Candidatus Albibeggiatoa sp. nov. NOAA]|uniref:SAV_2336 N-terminal domain-related protein n=1 Tax=Candidatus Albibeggiatoa sp. nov. NOAA TaxID=3162724 RepID=UPI003304D03B|nr:SAV_2336 family protein [Thiotrichaceae bacterium]